MHLDPVQSRCDPVHPVRKLREIALSRIPTVLQIRARDHHIRAADVVTCPYDIIATIDLPEQRLIGRLVMDTIHGIAGLKRTITCLAIQ